jgi:hypothetical protein
MQCFCPNQWKKFSGTSLCARVSVGVCAKRGAASVRNHQRLSVRMPKASRRGDGRRDSSTTFSRFWHRDLQTIVKTL